MKQTIAVKQFSSFDTIPALSYAAGMFKSISEDFDLHRIQDYPGQFLDGMLTHKTAFHQIILITKGNASLTVNNTRFELTSNKMLFLVARSAQRWETSDDIEGYRLLYQPKYFAKFLSFGNWSSSPNIFLTSSFCKMDLSVRLSGEFALLMEQILAEAGDTATPTPERREMIDQLNLLLLLKLKRIRPDTGNETLHLVSNEANGLRIVNDFLKLINEDLSKIEEGGGQDRIRTITDIAAQINVHPNYLNRVVHKIMGISVSELLRDIVLKKAKTILIHSDLTISQIAYKLGFQSVSYFCFYYKKHTGISPSEYRRQVRNQKIYT